MEYYNEFKLTMETNAKAKEASEILINRLNKGFEIDNTYRFNPSSKMAQVISANDNTVTLDGYDGYYTVEDSEEVFFELLKVLAENLSEDTFSCEIINNSTYSEGTINTSFLFLVKFTLTTWLSKSISFILIFSKLLCRTPVEKRKFVITQFLYSVKEHLFILGFFKSFVSSSSV